MENGTTDLTDVDQETTKEEAFKTFQRTRDKYQREDISGTAYSYTSNCILFGIGIHIT